MNNLNTLMTLSKFDDALGELLADIEEIANDDVTKLCKATVALRDVKDEASAMLDVIKSHYSRLTTDRLPKALEKSEMSSVRIDGHLFSVTSKLFASIPENKREEGFKWLRDNGLGDVIKETANPKTLSSAIKTMIDEEGVTPPSDAITVHIQENISIRSSHD